LSNNQAGAGAGLVNAASAVNAATSGGLKNPNAGLTPSTGLGSIEASRGSLHVYVMRCDASGSCQPVQVTGEVDVLGNSWSGNTWSGNSWSGNSWSGNSWSANSWSGNTWSGNTWSGNTWSGDSWS